MHSLTSLDRLAEDISVVSVIVPELEFGDVKRHVFSGNLVKSADDAAFEDRPEAFNRVRVDRADDILTFGMVNDAVREVLVERPPLLEN